MDVSVIYVNWNCAEEILASVATVRQWTHTLNYELIVVDNASAQGTGELALDSGIRLIHSSDNRGFGAGCNLGASHATGRYLLFLNPDTRFLNDVLNELTGFLNGHRLAGAAGPLVVDESNNMLFSAGRSLPTMFNEFLQHSTLTFRFPQFAWTAQPYLTCWDHLSTREVESLVGACMLVRSELFKAVGGFDEKFFLYCEELDLCYRLRKAGFQNWYIHTARLKHKERHSTIKLFGSVERIVFQNMQSQHYYFRKHYGAAAAFLWRQMIIALYLVRYLKGRDKVHWHYCKWAFQQVKDV